MQPKFLSVQADQLGSGGSRVVAPMPGVLEKVLVKPGDIVKKGDSLAVLIGKHNTSLIYFKYTCNMFFSSLVAMKMEHILKAPKDATIKSIGGAEGDNVAKGAAVITFADDAATE